MASILGAPPDDHNKPVVLCHGDVSPEHVFVDQQLRVVGVIDWGMWYAGSPTSELASLPLGKPADDFDAVISGHGPSRIDSHSRRDGLVRSRQRDPSTRVAHHQRPDRGRSNVPVSRSRMRWRLSIEKQGHASRRGTTRDLQPKPHIAPARRLGLLRHYNRHLKKRTCDRGPAPTRS